MNKKNVCAAITALLLLSACRSTTQVDMAYVPNATIAVAAQAKSVVAVGAVTDNRGKEDPNRLGAIRDGFGAPLKKLETDKPVVEVVKKALNDGLSSVHLLAGEHPRYTMNVDMVRFDCNQYARREAHIVLAVSLVNAASQKVVYKKTITSDKVTGSIITLDAGIFASVDDLRQVANDVLQDAVDQLLADPAFSAALR